MSTERPLSSIFAVTRSSLPSWLKSLAATKMSDFPTGNATGLLKPPVPVPNNTCTVPICGFVLPAVIAISTFTRDALVRTYHLGTNAVDIVLLAPKPRANSARQADSETLQTLGVGKSYVLAFGGVTPNKNIERMLQAYALARRRHAIEQALVIVGRLPHDLAPQPLPGVITTGYQSDDVVAVLLRNAVALVFPSLYEGFGLPILEAMAAGVPVTCSNTAAIPEVAADAALYFDPLDVDGMAEQIGRLCQDVSLRTELKMRARARAAAFGWDRTARATLAVYRRVLSRAAAVPIDVGGPPRRAATEIS